MYSNLTCLIHLDPNLVFRGTHTGVYQWFFPTALSRRYHLLTTSRSKVSGSTCVIVGAHWQMSVQMDNTSHFGFGGMKLNTGNPVRKFYWSVWVVCWTRENIVWNHAIQSLFWGQQLVRTCSTCFFFFVDCGAWRIDHIYIWSEIWIIAAN